MKRLALLLLACAVVPSAAAAQGESFTAMEMRQRHLAGHEPLVEPAKTHRYALCAGDDQFSSRLLQQLPYSAGENGIVFHLHYSSTECRERHRRSLLVGARFLRGGAAEYLLERRGGIRNGRAFEMPGNEVLLRLSPEARSAVIFIQIGQCAARADPAGVAALLDAEVETPAERGAIAAVTPALAGCLPRGITLRVPPLEIRAYLAEGAYRNAVADRVGRN